MEISDHVVVLEHGRKIAAGPPAAVRADPRVIAAYLGTDDLSPLEELRDTDVRSLLP